MRLVSTVSVYAICAGAFKSSRIQCRTVLILVWDDDYLLEKENWLNRLQIWKRLHTTEKTLRAYLLNKEVVTTRYTGIRPFNFARSKKFENLYCSQALEFNDIDIPRSVHRKKKRTLLGKCSQNWETKASEIVSSNTYSNKLEKLRPCNVPNRCKYSPLYGIWG